MKHEILFGAVIIIALFTGLAACLSVEISVEKQLAGEIKTTDQSIENGVFHFSTEVYNSGSIPYRAITRLDIMEDEKTLFTSWSSYDELEPGQKKYFENYAYVQKNASIVPKIRVYFANEIMGKNFAPVDSGFSNASHGSFEISNVISRKQDISLDIKSEKDVNNLIVTASGYPPGWVFHYAKINLTANSTKRIEIPFEPDILSNADISIAAFSTDGNFSTVKSVQMDIQYSIFDMLSGFFSPLFSFFR